MKCNLDLRLLVPRLTHLLNKYFVEHGFRIRVRPHDGRRECWPRTPPTVLVMAPLMMATPTAPQARSMSRWAGRPSLSGRCRNGRPRVKLDKARWRKFTADDLRVALVFGIVVTGLIAGPAIRQ